MSLLTPKNGVVMLGTQYTISNKLFYTQSQNSKFLIMITEILVIPTKKVTVEKHLLDLDSAFHLFIIAKHCNTTSTIIK